ncbi:rna pseudouridine synthase [Cystoisospora suis]|uniref:Rna pseudouridine synthase n=1 Tax=Cystoisospora suis TaxID=483139 RepID=A0A2C6KJT6_9APIC|nr:rna pseudouridine synthase [Cystoisospora suis]
MSFHSGAARSIAYGAHSPVKAVSVNHHGVSHGSHDGKYCSLSRFPRRQTYRKRGHEYRRSFFTPLQSPVRFFSTGATGGIKQSATAVQSTTRSGLGVHTLRFVYNCISDRWFVVSKPPGWTLRHSAADRPSVENVLQPLLEAATTRKVLSLGESGSSGADDANPNRRTRVNRDLLKAMEEEMEEQQIMKGLYFPMQLDADAQGLLLVATDQAMDRQLRRMLFESKSIRREFRVLADLSGALPFLASPMKKRRHGGGGSEKAGYRMSASLLEVPSQTPTSPPTDFFLPSSTSHQCNPIDTTSSFSCQKDSSSCGRCFLSSSLSFTTSQRSNPSCSSSISSTSSSAPAVPVPPVSATGGAGDPPVASYSPSSLSLTTSYPADQSQVRFPVQSSGCVPEDPGLIPAEGPSSTHSNSSGRPCASHGRPVSNRSSPKFDREEYEDVVKDGSLWPCGEDFIGAGKRKKRGDTLQEGPSSYDDLLNCYGKELNGDDSSNTVDSFKYRATSTRDFGWMNGLPVFASALRWGWSPVERLLASRTASDGPTTAQKNTFSKTGEGKRLSFTAKSDSHEAHHRGQSRNGRSYVEPSAGVEAEKAVLAPVVHTSTEDEGASQDAGKRHRSSHDDQQERSSSLSFVNRSSGCSDESRENRGPSSEEMGKTQGMPYYFSEKKMPSEPPRCEFSRTGSNPRTVATMVPIRGCLRLWDPYRGELVTTGVLKSRIANRPVKLRPHQEERKEDSDSFRVNSSKIMKRRDLLQLLDGSHVPPGLEPEISQNALAYSTCLSASASSVLPRDFFFPLISEDPRRKNVDSLFPAPDGFSLREGREGRERGFGQETSSLLNSSFLARTVFRLLSLHRLQLAGDGRERVLGLYRVTTQEPPRCHQIRVHFSEAGCPLANDPLYHPVFSADFKKKVLVEKFQTKECSGVTQSVDSDLPSNPFGYESDDSNEDLQEASPTRTRQSHKDEDKPAGAQVVLLADQKEDGEEDAHGRDGVSSVSSYARRAESSPADSMKSGEKDGFLAFDPQDPIVPFFSLSRPAVCSRVEATKEREDCSSSLPGPVQRTLEGEAEKEEAVRREGDQTRKSKREDTLVVMMRQGEEEKNNCVTEGFTAPGKCQSLAVRCPPCQLSSDRICDIVGQSDRRDVTERSAESSEGGRHDGDDESLPVSGEAGRETRELSVLSPGEKSVFCASCRSLGLQSFRLFMKDPLRPHTSEELIFELDVPPEWGGGIRDALQEDEMEAWRESGKTMMQEAKQKQQLERQQAEVIEDGVHSRAVKKNVILGGEGYWHTPQGILAS